MTEWDRGIDMVQSDTFHDFLIFGARIENITKPFLVGSLAIYPTFDVSKGLNGSDQSTIEMAVKSGAVFSKYRESVTSEVVFPSLSLDVVALTPFRLFKDGWISPVRIGQDLDTKVGEIYQRLYTPERQRVYA